MRTRSPTSWAASRRVRRSRPPRRPRPSPRPATAGPKAPRRRRLRPEAALVRTSPMVLRCGKYSVPLDRPLLMGVVNVTPDSFSDGGRFLDRDAAIAHALKLVEDGADIVDIGGESSRPGSLPTSVEEELERIVPV